MSYEEESHSIGGINGVPKVNEVSQKFLQDLEEERQRLPEDFPLCALLIKEAYEKIYDTGRIPGREMYADVYKQKPMKITQRVHVPVKQFPTFNFGGKILGPKGNSLRRLQEETQCKILIKGRNSMRDKAKEEELRETNDPRFSHLSKSLFVEISTVATPAEAYARIAYALSELRKYILPDKNDEVSQEQYQEAMEIDPSMVKEQYRNKRTPTATSSKYMELLKKRAVETSHSRQLNFIKAIPQPTAPKKYMMKRPAPESPGYTMVRPKKFAYQ